MDFVGRRGDRRFAPIASGCAGTTVHVRADWVAESSGIRILASKKAAGRPKDLLAAHLIEDAGLTEFGVPTRTALAIGPDRAETIDPVTRDLKLY